MAIVKMKKLRLIALRSQRDELIRDLTVLGCVEVSEPDELLEDEAVSAVAARETSDAEVRRSQAAALRRALDVIDRYAPVKSPMFALLSDISAEEFFEGKDEDRLFELAAETEESDGRLRRLDAEETRWSSYIESLLPWESYRLPLSFGGTKYAGVSPGAVPAFEDPDALGRELAEAAPLSELFHVSSGREQHCLCVVYARESEQEVSDVLRAHGFAVSALRNIDAEASGEIARARESLAALNAEREELKARIAASAENRQALRYLLDLTQTRLAEAEAAEKLLATERTVTVTGWVPAPSVKKLADMLSRYDCAWETADPTAEETALTPIQLRGNSLTRPLTMVTEMYSYPAYDGVDPNPLMAPFFILFYGIMMADMGYGLLMVLAALIVKKKKPRGTMRNFFDLMLLCGVATFVVGAATGGFFGDFLTQLGVICGFTLKLPALIDVNRSTQELLYASIAIGCLQIIVGMGVSFYMQIRDGHFLDGLFDVGSWWLLFAGIGVFVLTGSLWLGVAGAVALIATQGRNSKSIGGKIVGGLGSLYDITGYFGDALSYARLMALMLAGGAVASAFNQIGSMTGNVVTFVIIAFAGHALNLGLNLIGCYVHDLRLQCLEYMGKFYRDGGRAFSPLKLDSKYYNVVCK
ncbi:MAG: V-type ATP synthase subunit I [Oscillospiraceae bacterium]|jgi:V/A-type H+-transporting ATPase subunit I|nr:V-type ATP synthase subunit I [Oscillospiraceae bacterium]